MASILRKKSSAVDGTLSSAKKKLNTDNAKGERITGFKAFHPFAVKHKNCLYKELLNKLGLKHHRSFQVSVSSGAVFHFTPGPREPEAIEAF